MPTDVPIPTTTYVIDPENPTEIARLFHQDALFTRALGGLFPEGAPDPDVRSILDIGCGPGAWVLAVAHAYPRVQVLGIDLSHSMVEYARAQARAQLLEDNANFQVMDATQPLLFPEASFDLVHARFVAGFLDRESWPRLLAECGRVLRPGGRLQLTECEVSYSTSPALQRLYGLLTRALQQTGRSFSVDGSSLGILSVLRRLLVEAGFVGIEQRPFLLDSSGDAPLFEPTKQHVWITYSLLKPFLVERLHLMEPEDYDALVEQAVDEMYTEGFCALAFGLTTVASVPLG